MKAVWKGVVVVGLVSVGAVIWGVYTWAPYPGDPTKASNMLYKYSNPLPTPKRVQIFSTGIESEGEPARKKPWSKWVRFETRDEAAIGSLVTAMREGAGKVVRPPLEDVVTYHIYFESSESKLPLYYQFYYRSATNEPSALSAYTTVGNLCDAEAVEQWFETNGILGVMAKE